MENNLKIKDNNFLSSLLKIFIKNKNRGEFPGIVKNFPKDKRYDKSLKIPLNLAYGGDSYYQRPPAPYVYKRKVYYDFETMKPEFYDRADDYVKKICHEVFDYRRNDKLGGGAIDCDGRFYDVNDYPLHWVFLRNEILDTIIEEGEKGRHFWNWNSSLEKVYKIFDDLLTPRESHFWKGCALDNALGIDITEHK